MRAARVHFTHRLWRGNVAARGARAADRPPKTLDTINKGEGGFLDRGSLCVLLQHR